MGKDAPLIEQALKDSAVPVYAAANMIQAVKIAASLGWQR